MDYIHALTSTLGRQELALEVLGRAAALTPAPGREEDVKEDVPHWHERSRGAAPRYRGSSSLGPG